MIQLNQETIQAIAREVLRQQTQMLPPRYVNAAKAAEMLGISVSTLRQNKDGLPYIKKGDCQQGQLYFDATRLAEAWANK